MTLAEALELSPVESHLHPEGSFDLADHPVPTGLEEIWRFTPLKRLRDLHQDAPLDGDDHTIEVVAAPGVTAVSVPAADSARGASGYVPVDRVSARAWAAATSVLEVTIPAEAVIDEPTTIRVHGGGIDNAGAGHLLVRAGQFSKAVVVVDYDGSATWAENIEVVVEDGAQLTFVTIQDWNDDSVHVVTQHATVGRDAELRHVAISLGGDVVRASTSADYRGTGGSVEMLGVYFADAGQHIEHRLFADHTAPRTKSNVEYKGALQGQDAHTVWIGNVLIRKEAEGILTYESNDNLVLTDGAKADSVPNLEIETGDIEGAGHASTTGRFDDQHLFYLQSRGIPEEEARRLVVHGFFNDIIRRIGVPALQERLVASIEDELAEHVGRIDA
ncbi:Fe-S cluster assembly protein SufD [Aeromicrobium sp. CFBP 8757]|uniref:Fe-S cluster assembly protein SufD n=1 Tax=Aeromicrobium sp. CFBP 8757 TaxID=2775288 RepID=UPI00177E8D44|nr:Fe-S cluster assembly protein SufD [Aeromicrobium sp. CFBP 8757]MBD8606490.1 Fe-S cluster assembly protein SufD [Aeromicrobium sp. CFBP 8757]